MTYAALNDAALVISGDRVAWTGPASRAPAADRAGPTDGSAQHPWFEQRVTLVDLFLDTTSLISIMHPKVIFPPGAVDRSVIPKGASSLGLS